MRARHCWGFRGLWLVFVVLFFFFNKGGGKRYEDRNRNGECFPMKLQLERIRTCNCNSTDTWSSDAVHQFHTSIFSRIYAGERLHIFGQINSMLNPEISIFQMTWQNCV